jgi:putative membrane protein
MGPWALLALFVVLIGRALLRAPRYRAVNTLSEEDREVVHEALRAAERRTVGEIVPVVVERSDPHPAAHWIGALAALVVGSALLAPHLPWDRPALFFGAQLGLAALGWVAARTLPDLKHVFLRDGRATAVAEEQALQEFFGNGLHQTEGRTGVLLFVSLLEHRVIVLADRGIDSVVGPEVWRETDAAILEGIRKGSLCDGLVAGIERAGDVLAEHFPWAEGDRNELPDRVVVRRE